MTEHGSRSANFILVMGVSGSGKSTIGAMLAARLGWRYEDADWLHPPENVARMQAGQPLSDQDRWPWLAAIRARIDEARATGQRAVIACSALKRIYRDVLIGEHGDVRLVFLKGTPSLIARRTALREGHFMPDSLLGTQFATLEEPTADEHPIVVSIEQSAAQVVETILGHIGSDVEPDRAPPRE